MQHIKNSATEELCQKGKKSEINNLSFYLKMLGKKGNQT